MEGSLDGEKGWFDVGDTDAQSSSGSSCSSNSHKGLKVQATEAMLDFYFQHEGLPDSKRMDPMIRNIEENCVELWRKDYGDRIVLIPNQNGSLCASYPENLVFCVPPFFTSEQKVQKVQQLLNVLSTENVAFARARTRFPHPVIWTQYPAQSKQNLDQYLPTLSRSAGLSGTAEILYRNPKILFSKNEELYRLRGKDLEYISTQLGVRKIVDLMNEEVYSVGGVAMCSSEKAHDSVLSYEKKNVRLIALPFPGVDFYKGTSVHFDPKRLPDWEKTSADLALNIDGVITANKEADSSIISHFGDYKKHFKTWGVLQLSREYFYFILYLLKNESKQGGALIHCVSGWDRTPLWVSVLRVALWSVNQIHKTLTIEEIVYLTVAYDWLLFGHNLVKRRNNDQDIFTYFIILLENISDIVETLYKDETTHLAEDQQPKAKIDKFVTRLKEVNLECRAKLQIK